MVWEFVGAWGRDRGRVEFLGQLALTQGNRVALGRAIGPTLLLRHGTAVCCRAPALARGRDGHTFQVDLLLKLKLNHVAVHGALSEVGEVL